MRERERREHTPRRRGDGRGDAQVMEPRLALPASSRAEAEPLRAPRGDAVVETNTDRERRIERDGRVRFAVDVVAHKEARLRGGRTRAPEVRHCGVLRRPRRFHFVLKDDHLLCRWKGYARAARAKRLRAARLDRRAAAADATRGGVRCAARGNRRAANVSEALAEVRIRAPRHVRRLIGCPPCAVRGRGLRTLETEDFEHRRAVVLLHRLGGACGPLRCTRRCAALTCPSEDDRSAAGQNQRKERHLLICKIPERYTCRCVGQLIFES